MWSIAKNFGSNDAYTVRLDLTAAEQSVENNRTALHFACWLISNRASASFTGQAKTDTLTVAGVTVNPAHGYYVLQGGGSVLLWECDMTVGHDSDGTFSEKAVSCGVLIDTTFSSSGYIGTVTAEGTMTLTTIPRASTMTVSGSTLGSDVTFNISAASAAFTHSLTYDFGDAYGTLLDYKPAGTHRLPMPLSLASQFPNAKSGTVTYTLYTWNGVGVSVGVKTYTATLTIPSSAAPSVASGWASAAWYNEGTAAASIDAFVQGYSKAQVTFDSSKITTKYGATIQSYKIACGSVTDTASPYLTGVLTGTSATITCTVTDSRGYTATGTVSVTLYPYKKPALSDVALYRADEDGTANRAGLCIYAKATLTWSDIGGKNSCSMKGYYRLQSGSYPAAGTEMTSGVGILLTVAAAVTSTYVAKITAVDSLGNTAVYEATIPTDNIAFHLREGGQGAAFGKYSEQDDLLDVGWNLRARKKLTVDGDGTFGGSMSASGEASVGGNLSAGKSISSGTGVELGRSASGHGGYLDFHFNGSTGDFTSRIIESANGVLELNAGKTVTLGKISNPTDVLKTLLNPTNFGYITDFNTGKAALPGLWRVYNADGSAAHAPYSGAVSGVCLVVVVYTSDGTMDKAHQLFLDGLGDVYYKVYNNGVSYGAWKKLTN